MILSFWAKLEHKFSMPILGARGPELFLGIISLISKLFIFMISIIIQIHLLYGVC